MPKLQPSECRLLSDSRELIDAYNMLVGIVDSIKDTSVVLYQYISRISVDDAREIWEKIKDEEERKAAQTKSEVFERVRLLGERLKLDKYRIGFVGESQAGKSTAVNSAIGCKLVPEGGRGKPCTSAITRIHFLGENDPPAIELNYMSRTTFRNRLKFFVCHEENLNCISSHEFEQLNEQEIIARLETYRASRDLTGSKITLWNQAKLLAQSAVQYGTLFGDKVSEAVFSTQTETSVAEQLGRRLKELVGMPHQEPSERVLLQDVVVSIPFASASQTVEMIDLPGLGTDRIEDDELTMEYIKKLDGLVVFANPNNVTKASITKLIEGIGESVGDVHDRVWFIVSCMDEVRDVGALYDSDGDTIFKSIRERINKDSMQTSQCRFLSVKVPDADVEGGYSFVKDMTVEERAKALKLKFRNDEIVVPSGSEYEPFSSQFSRFIEDGGLEEFKGILQTQIADSVRRAVWKEVRNELTAITQELASLLETAKQLNLLKDEDTTCAAAWNSCLNELIQILPRESAVFDIPAKTLFEGLWTTLDGLASLNTLQASASQHELHEHHRTLSHQLSTTCKGIVFGNNGIISKIYHAASDRLLELARSNEIVKKLVGDSESDKSIALPLPAGMDPVSKLQNLGLRYQIELNPPSNGVSKVERSECGTKITADCDSFKRDILFSDSHSGQIGAKSYRRIMERKVESVAYQILQRVKQQLIVDCSHLARQMRILSLPTDEQQDFGEDEVFTELANQVKKLEVFIANSIPEVLSVDDK